MYRLRIHLLDIDPATGRGSFHVEPPGDDEIEVGTKQTHQGVRGWAEKTVGRFREKWQHSDGRAVETTRRIWAWLHKRTHPDEPLLARLRSAGSIDVIYPTRLEGNDQAQITWRTLLARSRRRHAFWFVANLLVAPLSILLAPLPGPNILGYWFAYRAVHHGLILVGIRRVRKGRVPTRFVAASHDANPGAVTEFLRRHIVFPSIGTTDSLPPWGNQRT